MRKISLKYRITIVILLMQCMMVYFVLGPVQSNALRETEKQLDIAEYAKLEMLSELSRISLFTSEYDELQPFIETMSNDPNINTILISNSENLVVSSSDVSLVGQHIPQFIDDEYNLWKVKSIQSGNHFTGQLSINFSRQEMLKIIENTRQRSWYISIIFLIIFTLAGLSSGYLLTRRLNILANTAKRISEGDYETNLNYTGSDELSVLGNAIDKMSQNIKQSINKLNSKQKLLINAKEELEVRVEDRTKELALARDKAMDANRAKSAFLANMSHELHTPLNIIIGYSELIESDPQNEKKPNLLKDIKSIKDSGNRLLNLVDNILNLSKIEAGRMDLSIEENSIKLIVKGIIEKLRPEIEMSGNTLSENYDLTDDSITSDTDKIRKIICNILDNANKFTSNGNIKITLKNVIYHDKKCVECDISDTGIGMDQNRTETIFADFSQGDNSYNRQYEGSGLGLAISMRYCQLLGGNIEIVSEEKNGSTFKIFIPQYSQQDHI